MRNFKIGEEYSLRNSQAVEHVGTCKKQSAFLGHAPALSGLLNGRGPFRIEICKDVVVPLG